MSARNIFLALFFSAPEMGRIIDAEYGLRGQKGKTIFREHAGWRNIGPDSALAADAESARGILENERVVGDG